MSNGPYHLYDTATGLFVGQTFHTNDADPVAAAAFAKANTPEGHAVYTGHVGDHSSLKVDLATGELVDYQPPQPSADHEWNPQTKRWHQTGAAAAREAARRSAIARIDELEASQHRFVRELLALGDLTAIPKLREIYGEIRTLQYLYVREDTAFGLAPPPPPLPKLDDATLNALMEFAHHRLEAPRPQLLLPAAVTLRADL